LGQNRHSRGQPVFWPTMDGGGKGRRAGWGDPGFAQQKGGLLDRKSRGKPTPRAQSREKNRGPRGWKSIFSHGVLKKKGRFVWTGFFTGKTFGPGKVPHAKRLYFLRGTDFWENVLFLGGRLSGEQKSHSFGPPIIVKGGTVSGGGLCRYFFAAQLKLAGRWAHTKISQARGAQRTNGKKPTFYFFFWGPSFFRFWGLFGGGFTRSKHR